MKFPSARRGGRVFNTVLACALAAISVPAFAQNPGPVVPNQEMKERLFPAPDAYSLLPGDTLAIVAPGVMVNDQLSSEVVDPTVSLLSGPSHGALLLNADGGFEYAPAKGFTGVDTFRYRLQSGSRYGDADVTLMVFAPSNVALSAAADRSFVEVGAPVMVDFAVANDSPHAASDVVLDILVPAARDDDGTPSFMAGGCVAGRPGTWRCALGMVAAGTTVHVPFAYVPVSGGDIDITGLLTSSDPDANTADNVASVHAAAGRLSMDTQQVVARVTWPGGATEAVTREVKVLNEWPFPVKFKVSVDSPDRRVPILGWIKVSPDSGLLASFYPETLTVSLATLGEAPGLKRAAVYLQHDSPFKMPGLAISYTLAFKDVPAERADDVYIHALAGAGVTGGCAEGLFCPEDKLLRGGSTVWLLLAGEGSGYRPSEPTGIFTDVGLEAREAGFIEELARRGVINGCDAERFCPDEALARADAAVMVMRMLYGVRFRPTGTPEPMFKDMTDDPRRAWVEDAVLRGFFSACDPDGALFCPDEGIARGDAAVAVAKAFNLPLF